ncbi:MAG TPA: hypothetical protein PLL30_16005 [Candidatus Krumholzibacteria bacterium]|nr:hypothetical protein [Candidatus Krumholzibacteria bacterium]HPD73274.1 hypothetical protein [Candidatus Krumholzibacteria bacterium]HRY40236.1 hypothetical protein [Candidatus Krumholzibacteria bacterium]
MRTLTLILVVLALAWPAAAYDLGTSRPVKPESLVAPPARDLDALRQGGDTLADAVYIPQLFDFSTTGTTAGYSNDYDEVCPYSNSMAPDVVYRFAPPADIVVAIDMYGSSYDTKIYVYREDFELVACNDDFYSDWTSKIENLALSADTKYFLVIDGYGTSAGAYVLTIDEYVPCVVDCPVWSQYENEPPLVDGYVDHWNGGCNTPPDYPFQNMTNVCFCGRTGYYLSAAGASSRDTDWLTIYIPNGGVLEITGDAEEPTYLFELGPQDCGSVDVVQNVPIGPCEPATMTIVGPSGSLAWVWVGPQHFWEGFTYEYDYRLGGNGCYFRVVEVETRTWTNVKGLFR